MTVGVINPALFGYRDLVKAPDNCYYDPLGTIWAVQELTPGTDPVVEIGIGRIWALTPDHPYTPAAVAHDAAYSNPVYQQFHYRLEADMKLFKDLLQCGASQFVALLFYGIVRTVGGSFWENEKTR